MNTPRQLRSLWIPSLATMGLLCVNDAVAHTHYQVTDMGTLQPGFFGCTMGVNNHGSTETQYGLLDAAGALQKGHIVLTLAGRATGSGNKAVPLLRAPAFCSA